MSLAGQQLVRCPHCISVQPRGPAGELLLNPGENRCANRNCNRTFMGHQAIQEDYPRDGRRGAPPTGKPSHHQAGHSAPLQFWLFGRKK